MHYFSDIDECQNKSGINCDQLCVNLPGSYFCDCNNGYKLNADGGTCDGKPPNFFYSCPITLSPVQFLWVLFRFVLGIRMTQKWNWIGRVIFSQIRLILYEKRSQELTHN